jgi:protein associated with RNAse G/E
MAVKEANLKITVSFEMDEEQLRDIFESLDIKFTKKKIKELQEEMELCQDSIQVDMEERFAEIVEEWIQSQFDE